VRASRSGMYVQLTTTYSCEHTPAHATAPVRTTLYAKFQDVQRKLCATLAAKSLVTFKFEDFLTALNLINRLINVGDIFTGTQSPTLRTAIKQHAVTYFKAAHRQRMEVRPAITGRGR